MSNNQAKFGVHEHGETLTIDLANPKIKDCLHQVYHLHTDATAYLTILFLALIAQKKINLPCKKCLLDAALQFKDVGAMLEELAGFNPK